MSKEHRTLKELVPRDHVSRHLKRVRPSIDWVVSFKLALVLSFDPLCSERHLMRLVADRLVVRWYFGYDLGEALYGP